MSELENKINIIESSIKPRKVGKNVTIIAPCNIYDCEIGDNVFIGPFTEIQKNVKIGNNCRIQSHSFICEGVEIGNGVFWGHGTISVNDLSPKVLNKNWELKKTIIKDGVSIGSGVILLPVTVGEKSLIGAGTIVTSNVPNGAIWKNSIKGEFHKLNFTEDDLKNEIWKDLVYDFPILPNYQVSNLGRIRNKIKMKILSPAINQTYFRVGLMVEGSNSKCFLLHRLMCFTFHGAPPFSKAVVNHINGCSYDNRPENLEWVSQQENQNHMIYKLNTDSRRFTDEEIYWIRKNCIPKDPMFGFRPLAEKFGVGHSMIRGVYYGRIYSHLNNVFCPGENGDGNLRGEERLNSKLKEADVKYIRDVFVPYHKQFGMNALARKFGVDHTTIDSIIKRERWKHI